ncbi:MAG: hypothetical protein ACPG46_08150 [Thalassotalea sp.]
MKNTDSRYVQIDDWIFEVKTVRALKVDKYGDPYKAIANCNINGDNMYVDGLLSKNDEDLSKEDYLAFLKFSRKLGLKGFSYHRFHNGESSTKNANVKTLDSSEANVEPNVTPQPIRLVK